VPRLLFLLLIGAVALFFAWSNTHHVEVGLLLGRPVHVRLIFLLLTTFLLGHFTAVLLNVYMRTRIKAKIRRKEMAEDAHGDEDEDLFLE